MATLRSYLGPISIPTRPIDRSSKADFNGIAKVSTRSRTGCLTCRRRKKKCDERQPICSGCDRNQLACEWVSNELVPRTRRSRCRRQFAVTQLPHEAQAMLNVFAVPKPGMVERLLSHFIDHSPRWLSTRTGTRRSEFLKYLLPAVSGNLQVHNCVLMIASADLAKYCRDDVEVQAVAVEYYGKAVSALQGSLNEELATMAADNLPGSGDTRIVPHLNAAAALLLRRLHYTPEDLALRGFLFELFCYYFSLVAFSHGSKLSLCQASAIFSSPIVTQYLQQGNVMGTSQRLFKCIFQISMLAEKVLSERQFHDSPARMELALLEQQLVTWQLELPTRRDTDISWLNDAITSELYRVACLIYIKKVLDTALSDHSPPIQALVLTFVEHLGHLPPDAPSNNILCWPLVVVGLSAVVCAHQRAISTRLGQIYDIWRSDILCQSAAFLRQKWRDDRNPNRHSTAASCEEHEKGQEESTVMTNDILKLQFPVILV
ncbi:fungal-specific transcription factor domain-containing protein [Aspergillus pseudotamarii]|uniref:Fungal-specific transcription factor domain-containing protein n=1 Tax=Aspergillus pseudotamarii TaxID=132259 RepID=A0A5N6T633_ASPPS|nr:fungal-specific transcription factor domain-containing protein [Aspergillus pseudotamarii]KAE8141641.1 fungal-specific transcription factor domain-containing protein [Aspergillus pseudotamarii]